MFNELSGIMAVVFVISFVAGVFLPFAFSAIKKYFDSIYRSNDTYSLKRDSGFWDLSALISKDQSDIQFLRRENAENKKRLSKIEELIRIILND